MARLSWAQFGEAKIRKAVERDHASEIAIGLDPAQLFDYAVYIDDDLAARSGYGTCYGMCCVPPIPEDYDMRFVELRVALIDLARI